MNKEIIHEQVHHLVSITKSKSWKISKTSLSRLLSDKLQGLQRRAILFPRGTAGAGTRQNATDTNANPRWEVWFGFINSN